MRDGKTFIFHPIGLLLHEADTLFWVSVTETPNTVSNSTLLIDWFTLAIGTLRAAGHFNAEAISDVVFSPKLIYLTLHSI